MGHIPSNKLVQYVKNDLQGPNDLTDSQVMQLAKSIDDHIDEWFVKLDRGEE